MTDTTTSAGADDRVSEGAVEAAAQIADVCDGYWDTEEYEQAAIIIQDKAITPALARHQQAVDELVAAMQCYAAMKHAGKIQIDTSWPQAWSETEQRMLAALAAHRPLVSQSQEKK